jgi:hypothetical protein
MGKDEDYLWYSTGDMAGLPSEASVRWGGTLQTRYIRGAFDDKPFTLGKYGVRIVRPLRTCRRRRRWIYSLFKTPRRRTCATTAAACEKLYRANRPNGEVLLLPRSRVHEGDVSCVVVKEQANACSMLMSSLMFWMQRPRDEARNHHRSF